MSFLLIAVLLLSGSGSDSTYFGTYIWDHLVESHLDKSETTWLKWNTFKHIWDHLVKPHLNTFEHILIESHLQTYRLCRGMVFLWLAAGWMFRYVHAELLFRIHVNKMLQHFDQLVWHINTNPLELYFSHELWIRSLRNVHEMKLSLKNFTQRPCGIKAVFVFTKYTENAVDHSVDSGYEIIQTLIYTGFRYTECCYWCGVPNFHLQQGK